MAELFATSKQTISYHIVNILKENELTKDSVVKEYLTTAADGKSYNIVFYSLEMIIAVGYRVRGMRGTQFRQWATKHLSEYLVKGFVMDDEMERYAKSIYASFDAKRKQIEAQQADADDLKLLEDIERRIIDQNKTDKQ